MYLQLHECFKSILSGPESTIKRLSLYVIILLCQIIYGALETRILLFKYCDYLSMSNNLYGARETNIVLIVLYTLWLCDQFPYPYGFIILYGSMEINDIFIHQTLSALNLIVMKLHSNRHNISSIQIWTCSLLPETDFI